MSVNGNDWQAKDLFFKVWEFLKRVILVPPPPPPAEYRFIKTPHNDQYYLIIQFVSSYLIGFLNDDFIYFTKYNIIINSKNLV